jgi:hypothetical protein
MGVTIATILPVIMVFAELTKARILPQEGGTQKDWIAAGKCAAQSQ